MAREFAKWFYDSKQWRLCRKNFISQRKAIDGGMCERCNENVGFIVHHRIWLNKDNIHDTFITLNHSNLMYVCKSCHDKIHAERKAVRVMFDDDGNVIPAED